MVNVWGLVQPASSASGMTTIRGLRGHLQIARTILQRMNCTAGWITGTKECMNRGTVITSAVECTAATRRIVFIMPVFVATRETRAAFDGKYPERLGVQRPGLRE